MVEDEFDFDIAEVDFEEPIAPEDTSDDYDTPDPEPARHHEPFTPPQITREDPLEVQRKNVEATIQKASEPIDQVLELVTKIEEALRLGEEKGNRHKAVREGLRLCYDAFELRGEAKGYRSALAAEITHLHVIKKLQREDLERLVTLAMSNHDLGKIRHYLYKIAETLEMEVGR